MSSINPVYIENIYNGNYFVSVMMAMFYHSSNYAEILDDYPEEGFCLYLQDLIKQNFVEKVKRGYMIEKKKINEIRNFMGLLGLGKDMKMKHIEDIDPVEFYKFLIGKLSGDNVRLDVVDIEKNKAECINVTSIDLVTCKDITLKSLFENWISDNVKGRVYCLSDIPRYLCFSIKREVNDASVNLNYRVCFSGINDIVQSRMYWTFYSVVCKNNDEYVVFIRGRDIWLMYNYNKAANKQLTIIDSLEEYRDLINKNSVMVLYDLKMAY